jgi:hypothetical protein
LAQRTVEPFDTWQDQELLRTKTRPHGPCGPTAWVEVLGDIWFRGYNPLLRTGGIFSLRRSESEFFNQWGDTAESEEVGIWLDRDTDWLLPYCSMTVHNNYLLTTVAPEISGNAIRHRGLAVLDLAGVSKLGQADQPAWEGLWTGAFPVQLSGRWMLCRDNDGQNRLYELTRDADFDVDSRGRQRRIETQIETAALNHKALFEHKILQGGRVQVAEVRRQTRFDFAFKQAGSTAWTDWHTATRNPVVDPGDDIDEHREQGSGIIDLPNAKFDAAGSRRFIDLQERIVITGHAVIIRERRKAGLDDQTERAQCQAEQPTTIVTTPPPLHYSYVISE